MKKYLTLIFVFISVIMYSQNSPGIYTVKNAKINTNYSDFGTAFFGKDKVVFASPKQGITFTRDVKNSGSQPFLDLYIGELTDEGGIIKKQKMPGDINTKYHEGMVSFSKDMKSVYFSANWYIKKKKSKKQKTKSTRNIQIFKATINENGAWTNLKLLPFNSPKFSSGHPALNRDDSKLYFISDRPESIGKTDIYVIDIYNDSTYSEPRNLGPKINTVEREMFPFIGDDNILYFSSNGYPGYGELDVFASKIFDTTVSEPINLESPVNSEKDDFAYIIDDSKNKGYFSSNRKGGKGDDDIYSFTAAPPINIACEQVISGVVKDINTQEILPKALIVLFDEQGNELQSVISNVNDASFGFVESCNSNYKLRGYLNGHLISELDIKTANDLDIGPLEVIMNVDMHMVRELMKDSDVVADEVLMADSDTVQEVKTDADMLADSDVVKDKEVIKETEMVADTDKVSDVGLVTGAKIVSDSNKVTDSDSDTDDMVMKTNIVTDEDQVTQSDTNKVVDAVKDAEMVSDSNKVTDSYRETDSNVVVNSNLTTDTDKVTDPELHEVDSKNIINIKTIYFDFDKFNIRYDAKLELNRLVGVLKEYPEIEIDVNSHTDSRGKNSYNFTLSNNRANATIEYLVNKGVDPDRLRGKGFGEVKLAENCPNGIPCTGFQHQLNRRSEFSIVQNGLVDVTFRSNNISYLASRNKSNFTSNSGAYINYDFSKNTQVYTVQIGAFHGKVQTNEYSKLTNLFNHQYNDGFNRYYAGIFETSTEARNYMKLLRGKGFKGAFVVGLKGKDRF